MSVSHFFVCSIEIPGGQQLKIQIPANNWSQAFEAANNQAKMWYGPKARALSAQKIETH